MTTIIPEFLDPPSFRPEEYTRTSIKKEGLIVAALLCIFGLGGAALYLCSVISGSFFIVVLVSACLSILFCISLLLQLSFKRIEVFSSEDPSLFFVSHTLRFLCGEEETYHQIFAAPDDRELPRNLRPLQICHEGLLLKRKASKIERAKKISRLHFLCDQLVLQALKIKSSWCGIRSFISCLFYGIKSSPPPPNNLLRDVLVEILSCNGEEVLEAALSLPPETISNGVKALCDWASESQRYLQPLTVMLARFFLSKEIPFKGREKACQVLYLRLLNTFISAVCLLSYNDRKEAPKIIKKYCPGIKDEEIQKNLIYGDFLSLLSWLPKKPLASINLPECTTAGFILDNNEKWRGLNSLAYVSNSVCEKAKFDHEKKQYVQILKNLKEHSLKTFFYKNKNLHVLVDLLQSTENPFLVLEALLEAKDFVLSLKGDLESVMPIHIWSRLFHVVWAGSMRIGNICKGDIQAFCLRAQISEEDFLIALQQGRGLKFLFPTLFL